MNEQQHMDFALEVAEAHCKKSKKMMATPFWDKLKAIFARLRELQIPWAAIVAEIPAILVALSSGDLNLIWAEIVKLFGLVAGTPPPVFA